MSKKTIGLLSLIAVAVALIIVVIVVFAPNKTEARVLEFALSGNPDTLDPHATTGTLTFQAIRSVYDTLIEPDIDGIISPALAESWDVSTDGLVWTFKLRRGVRFHNGDTFTSADVKATFERVRNPEIASPHVAEFEAISSIETPDDFTVVFNLAEAYAPLLSSMASGWGAIMPKSLIESGHDFASAPVGTGPFSFVEWQRDAKIVLEKNASYWMTGYPKVDRITMNIIIEDAVRVQALLAGELDAIYNVSSDDVATLEGQEGIVIERHLTALVMVIAINTSRAPLDRLEVRQAINHAIDKQTALDIAYGGGEVVGTFMDYNDPYYIDTVDYYPYDPDKARNLLSEAGIGEDTVIEITLPQNFEPHVRAGELYQEMLEKVGLNVKLKLVDWSTWLSDVYRGGNYDLTVIGHTGKLDPAGRLGNYGTDATYVRWVNPTVAELIDNADKTPDFETRKALYGKALEIMAREVPHVYVGSSYRFIATRDRITGFHMDQKLDSFDFRYVEKK